MMAGESLGTISEWKIKYDNAIGNTMKKVF